MLHISGSNQNFQIGKAKNIDKYSSESEFEPDSIISYSLYNEHALMIKKDNKLYAIGNNFDNRITEDLPRQNIANFTEIQIKDKSGRVCTPISALCGKFYSLYLVSSPDNKNRHKLFYSLANSYSNPLLLDIGDRNPIALFGCYDKPAAIDSQGAIIFVFENGKTKIGVLPKKEKAVSVVIWFDFAYALGESGRLYHSSLYGIHFTPVPELMNTQIADISGSYNQCFAITKSGIVYTIGNNQHGQLGLSEIEKDVYTFKKVSSLEHEKIVATSSSYLHSLFINEEGKVFACGENTKGQLANGSSGYIKIYTPVETTIKSGATFCIAGYSMSAIFIGSCPQNCPNRRIGLQTKPSSPPPKPSPKATQPEESSQTSSTNKSTKKHSIKEFMPKVTKVSSSIENTKTVSNGSEKVKDTNTLSGTESELQALRDEIGRLREENKTLRDRIKSLESSRVDKSRPTRKSREKPLQPIGVEEIDSIRRISLIGKGGQSRVYKVARDEIIALKELIFSEEEEDHAEEERSIGDNFEKLRRLLQEIELINRLDHPNIIKGFGICFGDESHFPSILLEYCPHNLTNVIHQMTDFQRVTSIFETCLGMREVHSANIIHRNLKPENILIDEEGHVRVSDFGMSRIEDCNMQMQSKTAGVGNLKFKAPEILNESTHYNEKVDIYSFGVIMFFILTNGSYPKISIVDISLGKQASIPKGINDFSKSLINRCWSFDPEDRPSFKEIAETIITNKFMLIDGVEKQLNQIKTFLSL